MHLAVATYNQTSTPTPLALIYLPRAIDLNSSVSKQGLYRLPRKVLAKVIEYLHYVPHNGLPKMVQLVQQRAMEDPLADLINVALTSKNLLSAALLARVVGLFPLIRLLPGLITHPRHIRSCQGCKLTWAIGGYHSDPDRWGSYIKETSGGYERTFSLSCPGNLLNVSFTQDKDDIHEKGVLHQGVWPLGRVEHMYDTELAPLKPWFGKRFKSAIHEHNRKTCELCLREYGPPPPPRDPMSIFGPGGIGAQDPAFQALLRNLMGR
ncbi:MAG: hypothetical protein Q9227_008874 [Pyrenula ochraceoflavens]